MFARNSDLYFEVSASCSAFSSSAAARHLFDLDLILLLSTCLLLSSSSSSCSSLLQQLLVGLERAAASS
jgi:hypothetical protein